ncbi:MAG: hypothetical protein U0W40_10350 [Acidimicrobiia bacterium]
MNRPARDRLVPALTVVGIALFGAYKLWQCLVGDALVWQDSLSYEASASHSWFSRALWAGDRAPLTPVLWKLTGTETSFVVTQTLLSIVAWSVLAVVVGRLARPRWAQLVAGGLVLGFATATPIVQWDRSVLSESLSLSLVALLFAAAIVWARRPGRAEAAVLVTVALLFAAVRDTHIWVIAMLAVALGAYGAWRATGRRNARCATRVAWVAAALGVVVFVTGWGSASSHRTQQNIVNVYSVRVFPYADRIDWFADHGMPAARALRARAAQVKGVDGNAPYAGVDTNVPRFAALGRWLRDHGTATYVEWLLTHPGYVVNEPLRRPERTFNNAEGHLTYYGAPDRTDVSLANTLLFPPWWVVEPAALVAVLGAWWWRRWRLHAWQMVALLGVIGVAHMLIAWHGDGMEVTRHASIGNVQVRLAILVALGMLLPRAAAARSEDQSTRTPAGGVPPAVAAGTE